MMSETAYVALNLPDCSVQHPLIRYVLVLVEMSGGTLWRFLK